MPKKSTLIAPLLERFTSPLGNPGLGERRANILKKRAERRSMLGLPGEIPNRLARMISQRVGGQSESRSRRKERSTYTGAAGVGQSLDTSM